MSEVPLYSRPIYFPAGVPRVRTRNLKIRTGFDTSVFFI